MKALFVALLLLSTAAAQAAQCPQFEGSYFCVSDSKQMGLATAKIRDEDGHKFLELDFGNKILPMSVPLGGETVEIDEDTIVKSICPVNDVMRTEVHVKSDPTIIPVREVRGDGQGRLRVFDSVAGKSPAARAPRLVITCDQVLF